MNGLGTFIDDSKKAMDEVDANVCRECVGVRESFKLWAIGAIGGIAGGVVWHMAKGKSRKRR